ncbi:MAG: TRAP transporter substrate-binding protein [Polaromonas sp.]|nr:TRAP transporter substrate-binding protein [Polaromonas sp.]
MKSTRRVIMTAILAGAAAASWNLPAVAAPIQLNLADVLPETNFMVQNAKRFADEVAKQTNGDVVINIRPGGALGFKGPEQLRAVRDGMVPMADILLSQQIGDDSFFGIEGVPFLVNSPTDLRALHKFVRPEFDKLVASKYNQKILYMVPSPGQYLFLKTKTDKIDGLKNIKIRGADKMTVDIVSSIGMSGVLIPFGELIPALASGRVDGVATSATTGVDAKFWEFMKYVYSTNHTWSTNMVNINLDSWKKIPPQHQKTIEAIAAKLEPEFWEVSRNADGESLKKLTANGMEVVNVTPDMFKDMRKMAAPLLDDYLKRAPDAAPHIKNYLSATGRN